MLPYLNLCHGPIKFVFIVCLITADCHNNIIVCFELKHIDRVLWVFNSNFCDVVTVLYVMRNTFTLMHAQVVEFQIVECIWVNLLL